MEFDTVWDKIKKGLKDGASLSMEKIEEYTKIGKLKIEEFAAKRKIERNYVDIGERVYELKRLEKTSEIESDIFIANAIENVTNLRQELAEIEKKIESVVAETKAKQKEE